MSFYFEVEFSLSRFADTDGECSLLIIKARQTMPML
jgi:hypothetical protein